MKISDENPILPATVEDREEPLEVEGPPQDPATELLRDLTPRLEPEEEEELATAILADFDAGISDRMEWETRLAEWEDQYYNRTADKDFPWPGASNFHVPLTMMGVETYKPRLTEAVLGQTPIIQAVPATQAGEARRDKVETVLNWQAQTKLNLEEQVQRSAHLFLLPGIVYGKVTWVTDRRRKKFIREFPASTPIPAIFESLFGTEQVRDLEEIGEMAWQGSVYTSPQGGSPLDVKITVRFLNDPPSIQVKIDREVVEEGPRVDLIEPPDIIVPVKGGQDPGELPWIQHRQWLTENDLRVKVRQGRFYKDVVEELLNAGPPHGDQPPTDSERYRQSQDAAEGVEGDGASNARGEQFEVLEDYRRYDIDDDGFEEEIITWVCAKAPKKVLGWDYLDNVYAHGMRPIVAGRFFPVPFRWYGLSYAEMIRGIQDEINTIHNQRVDYATIQNLPMGFKRASATLPPISQRLRPGEFLDVDNPQQDILIPKWQGSPAWGQQEEATLMQYNERLSGLTDLSVGRQPNRVGATRTAAGTQTLLSEAGLRFKTAIQSFQRFWLRIFEQVLALNQEYLPPSQEFRITGRQPAVLKVKDRSEIRGKFELRLSATADNINRQQARDNATVIMQGMANPLAMQMGLVAQKGFRQAYEDWLKAYGKDPSFYLEDKAPIRSPQEELMAFNVGQYIKPVMGEDVQAHLMEHQATLQLPYIRPEVKALIRQHIQETIQLGQMMQMAQQMAAGGPKELGMGAGTVGPQAQNAQIGRQPQTPGEPSKTTQAAGMPS